MKYITLTLLLFINISLPQTCRLESEVPSTTPDSQFTDNGDGTISDNRTGLMWHKCQLNLSGINCTNGNVINYNWQQALDEADSNGLGGYNDWRLPNYKELLSIVEHRCYNPSINATYFPNTSSSKFWSASPNTNNSTYPAWLVSFGYGYSNASSRYTSRYVRLVRNDQ